VFEVLDHVGNYLATGGVALCLGYFTYRSTRAGQKDTERMQEKANRIQETQQALDSQKIIAEQWRDSYLEERTRRKEAEEDLVACRGLVRKDFEDSVKKMMDEP
jgi:hypothetical protein